MDKVTHELLEIPAFLRRAPGRKKTRLELEQEARALERAEAKRHATYWRDYERKKKAALERKAKERSARGKRLAKLPMHRLVFTDAFGQRVVTCGASSPRKATKYERLVTCKKCQAIKESE